jgi:hypothetical protein
MPPTIAPDVSEFQAPVDDSFDRDWLIFRICFNGNIDDHAAHNLAWAKKATAAGRIKGFTGYVVPLPGGNDACVASLDEIGWPHDAPVMIDAEKWRGEPYEIFGDHSDQFNNLAARIRTRQGGQDDLAWAYGNRGPDLEVWPRKASWLGWVVASYGGSKPDEPNLIGWQYTDGQPEFDRPDMPHTSAPFGRCDHNALYRLPGDDMPTVQDIMQHQLTPGGLTVAQALRDAHVARTDVEDVKTELDAVKAKLAAVQTAGVDPVALAKALAGHLTLTVAAK